MWGYGGGYSRGYSGDNVTSFASLQVLLMSCNVSSTLTEAQQGSTLKCQIIATTFLGQCNNVHLYL